MCVYMLKMSNSLQYVILNRKRPKGVSVTTEGKIGKGISLPVHTMQTFM